MKSHVKRPTGAAVWLGALLLALPVLGQQVKEDPARLRLAAASAAKAGKAAADFEITSNISPKTHVCDHFGSISCGQTVTGTLTAQDCLLNDDSRIDFWEFQGTSGQTVTVTMTSSQVDSYLFLFNPQSQTVAQNDDGAGGSNSRVVYPLNGSGAWAIGANALPNQTGNYSITLACSGAGGGGVPAAPTGLVATAAATTEIDLDWQDRSSNETGFVIQGRSGGQSFQDLGAVGANSTGATIVNLTPGTAYTFRVRARNAGGDSPNSNEATATTLGGDGGGDFLTSASFPDFRFRVRIIPQGAAAIQGRKESACIPETLCVSGAAAGRSEVFVRIVGPRPNGFLWPTIVRFTPARVEVEVQQISTGIQKTYLLPTVPPDSDELSGLQDRTGFLP